MKIALRTAGLWLAPLGFLVAGCMGDGSDIGPSLSSLDQSIFTVDLQAPDGSEVVDAVVDLQGASVFSESSGTAEIETFPDGASLLQIDAGHAGTLTTSRLGSMRVDLAPGLAAVPPLVEQSPFLVTLPSLAGRPTAVLTPGALVADFDYVVGDARIDLAAGTVVSRRMLSDRFDETGDATLSGSRLAHDRMPPVIGLSGPLAGQTIRASDAFALDPIDLAFAPAGDLSIDQDLGLLAGEITRVLRLDPVDGLWKDVGPSEPFVVGQPLSATGVVSGGGLYVFATIVPSLTLVGEVRFGATNGSDGSNVFGLRMRAGQQITVTDNLGRFELSDVGLPLGNTLVVHLDGGAGFGPGTATFELDLAGVMPNGTVDLGRLDWPFPNRTDFRFILLDRSVLAPFRLVAVNSATGRGGLSVMTDRNAELTVRDLELGVFSSLDVQPEPGDPQVVRALESFDSSGNGSTRTRDLLLFTNRGSWLIPPGSTLTYAYDERTRGYASGVDIFRTTGADEELVDRTGPFVPRLPPIIQTGDREQFTGVLEFGDVISAFSATEVAVGRLELLVDRGQSSTRPPLVEVSGTIPGAGPEYRLVASTLIDREAFFEERIEGLVVGGELPPVVDGVGPADPGFVAAVPARNGSFVAVASGTKDSTGLIFDRVHFVEVDPSARATSVVLDLGGGEPADSSARFSTALSGRDPRLSGADPSIDVGLELADGRVVALGADLGATLNPDGSAFVPLPSSGPFSGSSAIAVFTIEGPDGASTLRQRSLFIDRPEVATPLHPVPSVQMPAAGASVPVAGFDVEFTLPPGTVYGELLLRRDDGQRSWRVGVPPDATSYTFRQLPEGPQPLEDGNWTLTLRAFRIRTGPALSQVVDPYQSVLARRTTLGLADLGVDAVSELELPLVITP